MGFRAPSRTTELLEFYASFFVRNFAVSLSAIFEPIYLFLVFDKSITYTLFYFAIVSLMYGFTAPLGAWFAARVGERRAMLSSAPFLIGYYLSLAYLHAAPSWLIPLSLACNIVHATLFWPAFHYDFLRISTRGARGKEFGLVVMAASAGSAIAPLVGGVILSSPYLGFPVLFTSVLFLLFLSGLILLRAQPTAPGIPTLPYASLSYTYTWSLIFSRAFLKQTLAFTANGIESGIGMYVWPLFLFMLAFSFDTIGLLTFFAAVAGLAFTFFVGLLTDRVGARKVLGLASVSSAVFWLLKTLSTFPPFLFVTHTVHMFLGSGTYIPFMAIVYEKAAGTQEQQKVSIVFREVALGLGRGTVLGVLAFVFLFTSKLQLSFLVAALFVLLMNGI